MLSLATFTVFNDTVLNDINKNKGFLHNLISMASWIKPVSFDPGIISWYEKAWNEP